MKKIIWLIFLFPIFMNRVWANEVYYTEYGPFGEYQKEKVENSDVINVESITMYNWYKNIKIPGEFKLYNTKDNFLDNCYETNYSDWTTTKPNVTESMLLEEKTIYNYQMIKPVRYIHLYNLKGSYDAFRIPELQVFVDGVKINYTYTCDGCWSGFENYIHNGIYIENNSYIDNNGSLIIDLQKEYPINKIKVLFYIFDMGNSNKQYTLGYSIDNKNIFISKTFIHQFSSEYMKDAQKFEYTINDLNISDDLWLENSTNEQCIDNEYVYNKSSYQQYRYKEKLCQLYTVEREYYPQYSANPIGEYKLKDEPKVFYRYRIRDKLELNTYDITEKNFDLNKFVVFSTNNYSIKDNINWDKNGIYQVQFLLDNLQVDKNVKLNVLSNTLEDKEQEINKLKEELQNTKIDYEKIILTLEKNNEEYLKSLNDLNGEIIKINIELENLKSIDNSQLVEEINNKLIFYVDDFNKKIAQLDNFNQIYLENFNIFSKTMQSLEDKITLLETSNGEELLQLEQMKEQFEKYKSDYEQRVTCLENYNNEYITKIKDIDLEIKKISEQLLSLEIINGEKYDELNKKINANYDLIMDVENLLLNTIEQIKNINVKYEFIDNELVNLDLKYSEQFEKLNKEIDFIIKEVEDIYNIDALQNEQLRQLKESIEAKIKIYSEKIIDLENINKTYSDKIIDLKNTINSLQDKIIFLEKQESSNCEEIVNIKKTLELKINSYDEQIKNIEQFNKNFSKKYENIYLKIINLMDLIEQNNLLNSNLYDELNLQIVNAQSRIKIIEDEIIKTIEEYKSVNNNINDLENKISNIEINNTEIITTQESLNNKLLENNETLEYLKQINSNYLVEINKLNEEIIKLKTKINHANSQSNDNYKNLLNNQNLIYESLLNFSSEVKNEYAQQLLEFKTEILEVSKNIEPKIENDINDKLNNFVLKINGVEKINLIWLYIILSIVFIIYIVYRFRKKSNKKNS